MTEMYIAYDVDPKQASILKDLEDLIGKPIPKVNSIEKFTFGAKVVTRNLLSSVKSQTNIQSFFYPHFHFLLQDN